MFIPEYLIEEVKEEVKEEEVEEEEVEEKKEPKIINILAKDNIVEIIVNQIESIFNNIKPYVTMIMNFYKK